MIFVVGNSVTEAEELTSRPFTGPFIPGQNANFQYQGTAFKVGSGIHVQCTVPESRREAGPPARPRGTSRPRPQSPNE